MTAGLQPDCPEDLRSAGPPHVRELFCSYRQKLLRMISCRLDRRIAGKVDSEDVLQDVFVEVVRRCERDLQQPAVPMFVWLRQITSQVLIDLHRRYFRAQMRDVSQETSLYAAGCTDASSAFLAGQLSASLTTPSQCAVREETVAAVRASLERLGPMDREILVLRHLEELTNSEVAQVLGIDPCAASKRYLRALGRLKAAVAGGSGQEPKDAC